MKKLLLIAITLMSGVTVFAQDRCKGLPVDIELGHRNAWHLRNWVSHECPKKRGLPKITAAEYIRLNMVGDGETVEVIYPPRAAPAGVRRARTTTKGRACLGCDGRQVVTVSEFHTDLFVDYGAVKRAHAQKTVAPISYSLNAEASQSYLEIARQISILQVRLSDLMTGAGIPVSERNREARVGRDGIVVFIPPVPSVQTPAPPKEK